jgi:RNA polymerase sigma-32 factor
MTADASVDRYIQRARAIPRISREDEHDLALRARAGDQAAVTQLVEANVRFSVAIALQYRRYGIPISELIAEGNVGLMTAVQKFDPERGTRFVTYAGYWIRAFILEAVVKSGRTVGGGTGALRSKLFFRLRRERARAANVAGTYDEQQTLMAERFGVSTERMGEMLKQLDSRDVSLDSAPYPDSRTTLLDTLAHDQPSQESRMIASESKSSIEHSLGDALNRLDKRERFIIEHRVMGDDELSLAELGRKLGVSRERARQLEFRAKRKLREELQDKYANAA